jgi:hypothetical protein
MVTDGEHAWSVPAVAAVAPAGATGPATVMRATATGTAVRATVDRMLTTPR